MPKALLTIADYRKAARKILPRMAWDYFRSGSDGQTLLARNRAAWDAIELRPCVMVDVSTVDPSTTVLGLKLPFPALIAPMAYQKLAHKDGELAVARAAAACGVPCVVSTMATTSLEDIAQVPGPKWFQLYCHKDRAITEDLIHRAEAAGYTALVVTADAPVLGRRIADERNGFELPKGMTRENLARYERPMGGSGSGSHLSELFRTRQDAALNWRDLDWIRSLTRLPILLKGVLRPDDARRAVEAGCAGVIVSNHGGRQCDAAIATARALPEVAAEVGGKIAVLADGAIEWGNDILRALALGADAVLIGRPVLWGLAVAGRAGVKAVLDLYREDFTRAMQLCGCARVADARGLA
ncbi:MAG: alpha-hydroxy-acid oxidizing protein [Planctomycetes bacterium]|nr:alpha-hydroxy-acid oxidizing protein [Planctomycetota bacterium]